MILLTMLFIPTLIAVGFLIFGGTKFTLKEFLAQMGVQVLLMAICAFCFSSGDTSDVEILSGRVTSKTRDKVSCSH